MNAEIRMDRPNYQPGDEITGTVSWTAPKPPGSAELRLFWHTRGKGDRDHATVESVPFQLPQPADSRPFSIRAPDFPPSFSGKLISLIWGLELVLKPGGTEVVELVIGPGGQELDLHRDEWLIVPETEKVTVTWSK